MESKQQECPISLLIIMNSTERKWSHYWLQTHVNSLIKTIYSVNDDFCIIYSFHIFDSTTHKRNVYKELQPNISQVIFLYISNPKFINIIFACEKLEKKTSSLASVHSYGILKCERCSSKDIKIFTSPKSHGVTKYFCMNYSGLTFNFGNSQFTDCAIFDKSSMSRRCPQHDNNQLFKSKN